MITRGKWLAGILGVIAVVYQVGARTILALPAWTSLVVVSLVSYALISLHKRETIQPGLKEIHGLHALSFTSTSAWSAHLTRKSWEEKTRSTPLYKLASDKTNSVVDKIFALIKSSFILPWYSRISPSPAFPNAVDILIRQVLVDLVDRSESVDWATLSVSKILPRLTDHVHHFRSVEHLSSTSTPQPKESLPLPLPKNPHPAIARQAHMSSGGQLPPIEAHFRSMVSRVLESVLPESGKSNVVQTMVREVVLGSVLLPCFELLCDADFWNRQFEERGGRYLHEQKQVNKFLSALSTIQSKSDSAAASPVRPRATAVPTSITANSSTSQFEAFIRSISRVKTLGEARRLRADIEREQRVASMGSKQDIPTDLSQEKRAKKYLKRLDRAKLEVDARIASLSRTNPKSYTPASGPIPETIDHGAVNLYVVLTDPSSLAYWLEYMERRFRSKLVQFWLTIEGFKDPLEGIGQLDGTIVTPSNNAPNSHSRQTIGEDLAFLHQAYFAKPDPLLSIPERHVQTVNSMVEAGKSVLDPADIRKAKQAIFASQQAIYEQMEEEDWKGFKKSELYIKAISDLSHSSSVFTKPSPAVEPAPVIQRSQSVFSPKSRPQPKHSSSIPTSTPLHSMPSSPLMARPLPSLLGSYITPSPSVTSASVSVTPPHLEHRKSEVRPPVVRQTSAGGVDMTASTGSLSGPSQPVTPPAARRSKQLGFLIGDETESSVEREKLFGSDDEELLEDDDEDFVQVERMEAIQAALNDIMASDMASSRIIAPDKVEEPLKSPSASMVLLRKTSDTAHAGPSKKTSRSAEDLKAHAVAPPPPTGKRAVSGDKVPGKRNSMSELAKRKESFLFDDDAEDHEANEDEMDEVVGLDKVVHAKLPSDLDLSKEIDRLQSKIQDLIKQGHLLDSLIRQAELTGSQSELKLLRRSEASVRRDQRTAIFQKAQLEQREEERRLVPGRTRVAIPSSVVSSASEDGGKQIVRYTVEITQTEGETPSAVWTVSRRYNDFWDLDRSLREWNSVNGHPGAFSKVAELPPKKLVTSMSSSFVDGRRQGLERYLQSLVALEHFCEARPLKTFLSASSSTANDDVTESSLAPHNLVKSLYKTMTTSLDDAALAPSMLDVMSTTWQRQLSDIGGFLGIGSEELAGFSETYLPQALKPNLQRTDSSIPAAARRDGPSSPIQPLGGESGSGSFTAPICDLLIEVFDLKENNWLRRQAIVVVLQQFLGGTIERKFKDALKSALSEDSLVKGLQAFEEMMWPGGERRPASTPRTDQEKLETRIRAGRNLSLLIPDSAAYMIGRSNARRAARRVFGALQDQRLNQHLMLCIFDEIIGALFPKQVE